MLIIRLQKYKKGTFINNKWLKIILIEKGKASYSGNYELIGFFNINKNIIVLKYDRLFFWLSRGVFFSKAATLVLFDILNV